MNRTPVESSTIRSVGYDEADHTLEVEFVSGSVYQYRPSARRPDGVPPSLAESMLTATSVGTYFAANVKSAGFTCTKWDPASQTWVAIERRKASAKTIDYLRVLSHHKANLWGGTAGERLGPIWLPLLRAIAREADFADAATPPLVETWFADLWQDEASGAVDWLKRNYP